MIIREILGLLAALAGLVAMIAGLVMAGEAAWLIIGGMVVGTVGMGFATHGPADDDEDLSKEGG